MKQVYLIGGPNGAGKTTAAMQLLPNFLSLYEFVNADEIAKGLSPLNPDSMALRASKLMIQRILELIKANKSFAFETTCAGSNYVKHLEQCKKKGYTINTIFLWLPSPELALERVAKRVREGGHNIPEHTVRRRFYSGIRNFLNLYLPLSDNALIIDSSPFMSTLQAKAVIAKKESNKTLVIHNKTIWNRMQEQSHGKT